jgi:hypothetical protein
MMVGACPNRRMTRPRERGTSRRAPPLNFVVSPMTSMSAIKSCYYSIARQLRAPTVHVHFATRPQHDGSPHVERAGDGFRYIVTERGQELERRTTGDPDELLYWLVSDLTWAMASDHELAHRAPNQDFRRLLFQKHLELLAEVNSGWSQRKQVEYERVLVAHPFCDGRANQRLGWTAPALRSCVSSSCCRWPSNLARSLGRGEVSGG